MLGKLIIAFTVTPVVELALLIWIGQAIGVMPTVLMVIVTGIAGAVLAKSQGLAVLHRVSHDVKGGVMPEEIIIHGLLILCGGLFFLTPGVLTDLAGLLLLVPTTRKLLASRLQSKFERSISSGQTVLTVQAREKQ